VNQQSPGNSENAKSLTILNLARISPTSAVAAAVIHSLISSYLRYFGTGG